MRRRIFTMLAVAAIGVGTFAATPAHATDPGEGHGRCHKADPSVIIGTLGRDRLPGTDCDDAIFGLARGDVLIGNDGEDVLVGNRGPDLLVAFGDGEVDIVRGGLGNDRCLVGPEDITSSCHVHVVG